MAGTLLLDGRSDSDKAMVSNGSPKALVVKGNVCGIVYWVRSCDS